MTTPLNLRLVPWLCFLGDGTLGLVPSHVEQVRQAFELYLAGWTATEIAAELEANWTGKRQEQPAWDLKKVVRLLMNEAVVGDLASDKKLGSARRIRRNEFPAVITRAEFEQVQEMLRADDARLGETKADLGHGALRGRSIPEVDLFHGLCFCAVCGNRLKPKRLDPAGAWVPETETLDTAAVLATKPDSDDRPVIVKWNEQGRERPVYREGNRQERELRFDLKSKQQGTERLVAWVRTPEGIDRPTVLRRKAAKDKGQVYWACTCEGVGDVPAFFIENFLFEVVLPAARFDLTRVFSLTAMGVARAAQLTEQREHFRRLAEELGTLDTAEVARRMERLGQEVMDIASALPRLSLLVDSEAELAAKHKAFQAGAFTAKERELVRRRLWAAGTKVYLLRVPGIASSDHKFVLTGKFAELWGSATGVRTTSMLVHLRDGSEVLTMPWPANGETTLVT